MKIKPNYIVIPLITILVALVGSWFSSQGMAWYDTEILKPSLTPPKWVFPVAWNIIFILTTISAMIVWNKNSGKNNSAKCKWIITLFIANAVLNVLWSLLFFTMHYVFSAFMEMLILEATTIALMVLIWKFSKPASLMLLPYVLWVVIATYLTYEIYITMPQTLPV
ncbi:MAG: TspO/MBR family protein [Candidatus Gracilibacteria bacterium]|jgi:tryptophan-rich sensory protein